MAVFYDKARLISFFPVDAGSVAVVLYQDDGWGPVPDGNSAAEWAPFLNKAFAHTAKPIRRVLAGLKDGDDIYHDRIVQILPNQAVKGRVALIGDAGFAPTFLSGNGAAVASVAAWCLARSLRTIDDDHAALEDYEKRILPFAAGYQANARQMRDTLFARGWGKLLIRRLGMKYMPASVWARRATRHYKGEVQLADAL
jgi:2-polyprenyl-6-methoxyphenol hydroxylase-like FAD-dependent oxidoreductase